MKAVTKKQKKKKERKKEEQVKELQEAVNRKKREEVCAIGRKHIRGNQWSRQWSRKTKRIIIEIASENKVYNNSSTSENKVYTK